MNQKANRPGFKGYKKIAIEAMQEHHFREPEENVMVRIGKTKEIVNEVLST